MDCFFFKRKEVVNLVYPEGTNITGIACIDLDPDKRGIVSITEGGLYSSYVRIIWKARKVSESDTLLKCISKTVQSQ